MTAKEKSEQEKVEKIMKLLNCTEVEALDVVATDKAIDQGERTPYDLPIEEEKAAIRIANQTEYNKHKDKKNDMRGKVRAENPTKSGIIEELSQFLIENCSFSCENVQIINKERQIAFKCGENSYELTLVQKRKKKN